MNEHTNKTRAKKLYSSQLMTQVYKIMITTNSIYLTICNIIQSTEFDQFTSCTSILDFHIKIQPVRQIDHGNILRLSLGAFISIACRNQFSQMAVHVLSLDQSASYICNKVANVWSIPFNPFHMFYSNFPTIPC